MQSLWSRSGLAHRCHCRSCSTVFEAFGGRAAARIRRKPTFAEIFTACYSSVFATAALVDAIRKDDRRQNLDRQLQEARRDLAELQERRPTTSDAVDPGSQNLNLLQMDALWTSMKDIYINRPYMKEIHKPATISISSMVECLKRDYYGCPGKESLGAARRIDYRRLEHAIIDEEADIHTAYRQPQKQSHLRMESISTEELVLKFLDRAKFLPESELPSPAVDEARRMMMMGYPKFTFRAIDPEGARHNTVVLNRRLRSLISTTDTDMSMRERIGRVCYNLLISAYPPDMHTYNTLIVAFNKSGHHTFSEALVSSFFHSRLLQPTPSTFVAILNHYKCANNHGKFLRTLACLTGMESKFGGKIRRRHIRDIELSPLLQKWAADMRRRTQTGEWVWEHIPLSQPLVEEIICGLLHFKLFDQAVAFFVSSVQSGVKLSVKTARLLMDECAHALDWRAAVRMIRALTYFSAKWQRLLLSGDAESKQYFATRIRVLIDICGLNGPSQPMRGMTMINLGISNARFKILLRILEQEAPLQPAVLALHDEFDDSKSKLLQLESLGKEVEFVRKSITSIESKLLYPDFSHGFRVSMALHIGQTAIRQSLQLSDEFGALMRSSDGLDGRSSRLNISGQYAEPRSEETQTESHKLEANACKISGIITPLPKTSAVQAEHIDAIPVLV